MSGGVTPALLTPAPKKLHLGCGKKYLAGYFHVDALALPHVDLVSRVEHLPMIASGSVEIIYAAHVLEHFSRKEYRNVLKEWFRLIAPGGILRLAVPDFAACARLYHEQGLRDGLTGLVGLIVGGQRDEYDFHKMVFDEPLLTRELHAVGFKTVRRWDWRTTEHAAVDDYSQAYLPHLDKEHGTLMSLNLEAVK